MSVLDNDAVAQLREDLPPAAFAAVVGTFAADSDRLIGAMAPAAEAAEPDAFRRLAHTLAGAAGAVGARQFEATARRAMAAVDMATCRDLLPRLRSEAAAAIAALRAVAGVS